MNIYKTNDIRGLYPEVWDKDTAYKIGYVLGSLFDGRRVVIGRDGRQSSLEIFNNLSRGLLDRGFSITNLGMVDTPAIYYMVGRHEFDVGLMITASHNPVGYNGLKITGPDAKPVDYESGICELESLVNNINIQEIKSKSSCETIVELDITDEYRFFLSGFQGNTENIKAVFDCSNGMAGRFITDILKDFKGNAIVINDTIHGNFPAHGPNPSTEGSLDQLQSAVVESGADIGFCFDGDADRVVMVDETGKIVSPDIVTALLGIYFLSVPDGNPPGTRKVLVDLRSSNSVPDFIRSLGGIPLYCPVGHAIIKKMLRDEDALYAGELTGHYYFKDNYYCDSAWITVFALIKVLSMTNQKFSLLNKNIMKYSFSGEISYEVKDLSDQNDILIRLESLFSDASIDKLDGLRFNYKDWWFIIRKSGTEQLLRLVVEALTVKTMNEKIELITNVIHGRTFNE